jgi:O-methyltransferase
MANDSNSGTELYLELMKNALLGTIYPEMDGFYWPHSYPLRWLLRKILPSDVIFFRRMSARLRGHAWPANAYSMVGPKRLDNIRFCLEDVLEKNIPGDFIETGVWRGGACIFARGVLKAHGITDRKVWVADSFEGLPKPDAKKYPEDKGDKHHFIPELAVSLAQVRANFQTFDLLDDQVQFLKGWFKDTLPKASFEHLAVVRLDGDIYESTMDALNNLYSKLSVGGYLIVDDYEAVPACKKAIHDYRSELGINDPIRTIDSSGVFWRKSA